MAETWTNLTFHGVGEATRSLDRGEAEVWLSRDVFLGHLDVACENERVLITFDDGNLSDFEICLPALVDRGINGIFFIIAGRIGKPGYLGRDQIRALVNAGMQIGSHGMEHRPWRRMDQATMHHEIVDAKETLEEVVGRPIVKAACPFGAYDRRSLSRLREVGMQTVFTSDGGSARAGQWLQTRHTLHRSDPGDLVTQLVARRKRPESLTRAAKRLVKRWR
ncbi:MAG: polysaccharide deacetylase family protein [Myxococcales bacterium]|nr:polysaccharide deacetylase family protein [Myxococcales bacterium]